MFNLFFAFFQPISSGGGGGGGSISIGRSAIANASGSGSNYTVGFGSAASSGTWVVAIVSDSGTGSLPVVSGGSAWTQATGSIAGWSLYYKKCGGSEPTTYTVAYAGSVKGDKSEVIILEILGANATNPDDIQVATSTATTPNVSSSAASDAVVIGLATTNTTATPTAPSGYTIQQASSGVKSYAVALATQLNVGAGTISPGTFGNAGVPQKVWSISFKV